MIRIDKIGIDEVGRGPLAGPVTVCAMGVQKDFDMKFFRGITDSKKLSEKQREVWSQKIHAARKGGKLNFRTVSVSAKVIDEKGIVYAVRTAVRTALRRLEVKPSKVSVLLDGALSAPEAYIKQKTIIRGDQKEKLISAASVVAKVHRDAYMNRLARHFPQYGFSDHKGYGTAFHRKMINKHGLCEMHRQTFTRPQ